MDEIETIDCKSAREFFDRLDTSRPEWLPDDRHESPWVFRGQENASWQLVPSAWRPENASFLAAVHRRLQVQFEDKVESLRQSYGGAHPSFVEVQSRLCFQLAAEFEIVHQFFSLSNQLGIAPEIPKKLASGRAYLVHGGTQVFNEFAPFVNSIMALAQHHSFPTRLIDFTYDPRVAAFFAAIKADRHANDEMAVWAINLDHFDRPLEIVVYARSGNSFLHAQHGVCIHNAAADQHFQTQKRWPHLEEYLPPEAMRTVTLPTTEAQELLRLLRTHRISRAHLMPTYDNVYSTLELEWRGLQG